MTDAYMSLCLYSISSESGLVEELLHYVRVHTCFCPVAT
jgi:hypothetical protein